MRTRFVLAALALIAAGCGGGNTDETTATTTTAAPTTTTATPTTTDAAVPSTDAPTTTTIASEPVMFTERGPYGVGIATPDLGDRLERGQGIGRTEHLVVGSLADQEEHRLRAI